jgi:hypothetical protein
MADNSSHTVLQKRFKSFDDNRFKPFDDKRFGTGPIPGPKR